MAATAAATAAELQEALNVNWRRLESARVYLAKLEDDEDWQEWGACWDTINGLLDERVTLRARL